jgi:hypothetical protein
MVRVCRTCGRLVLVDLMASSGDVRRRFDHLLRFIAPPQVRTFLEGELATFYLMGSRGWPTPTR